MSRLTMPPVVQHHALGDLHKGVPVGTCGFDGATPQFRIEDGSDGLGGTF